MKLRVSYKNLRFDQFFSNSILNNSNVVVLREQLNLIQHPSFASSPPYKCSNVPVSEVRYLLEFT